MNCPHCGKPVAFARGGLTGRQRDLLRFVVAHVDATGVAPSFDQMMAGIGIQSKSGIHRLLNGLEERAFIRRIHGRARAIEVLRRAS